ncbi:DUF1573 domain-containing protein [Schlesneria paludicola]|uniref:DUF1573 domain-containing protein n=1 Tax=Schlesneria paludicola TaxID=360056 RepID=UPI00029ABBA1|nr:DUF1573 domain-containing protein [Schlesneria paludicola]
MKPYAILLTIVLGIASLCVVAWVGRGGASALVKPPVTNKPSDESDADELPMPKSGPFGKVEIEETEFDFGVKQVGSNDEHVFKIKNVGEGPLNFKLGKPTCQCTVGEITTESGEPRKEGPLGPGEVVSILVKWDMKAENEKFRQAVPVFTTDPEKRRMDLAITGVIDSPIHITPAGFWDLGEMSHSEPTKGEGYVYSSVLEEFTLTEVPRDNAAVKVTIQPADPEILHTKGGKSGYRLAVEAGPNVPIGMLRESIKVKAVSGETEVIREFTVAARRSGPIDVRGPLGAGFNVTTNRLIFTDFPAATGKSAKLTLFVKGMADDLVLQGVEPADSPYKIKLSEAKVLGNSKSYQLEVEIPPGPPGKHREDKCAQVVLKLNHPEAPDFRLLLDYNATR